MTSLRTRLNSFENEWQELCQRHLPRASQGSIWRYSRDSHKDDPDQGWKLHVSMTILTAVEVMRRVGPFLNSHETLFKAPSSLDDLNKLNAGLDDGYSQIGKCITVYPHDNDEFRFLAEKLDEFTRDMTGPIIPFESRYRPESCVYYRYGAFRLMEIVQRDGTRVPGIRNNEGQLVPDRRDSETEPISVERPVEKTTSVATMSPLATTYRAFRALSQRGKGGVYRAFDLSCKPPRLCILKEGRKDGEVSIDGRDGRSRITHEAEVLKSLRSSAVNVPDVYEIFVAEGNHYLVLESIPGFSLQHLLQQRVRRMSIREVLDWGIQLSMTVAKIHEAGWAWRDCKPANLMVSNSRELRPIDFEGACRVNEFDEVSWSTPSFYPTRKSMDIGSHVKEDVFAIGAALYFMVSGKLLLEPFSPELDFSRHNVPLPLQELVLRLLDEKETNRPLAGETAKKLKDLRFCLFPRKK